MRKKIFQAIILLSVQASFAQPKPFFSSNEYIHALKQATDIMVNDVTSPVAAGRYYAYITIGVNETCAVFKPDHPSLAKLLKGFNGFRTEAVTRQKSESSLAALLMLYRLSARLLPSGYLLNKAADSILVVAKKKRIPPDAIRHTTILVDSLISQMFRYVNEDGFKKLSGMRRYTPTTGDAYWQPTGPAFMPALEPYWNALRTFVLDSASQFKPQAPAAYSTDSLSEFYRQLDEVYKTVKFADQEKLAIAMFWDCNPFALQQMGHLEFGLKKISPGGHWMGITGIACKKSRKSLPQTIYIHSLVAVTLADAFVSCWDEKYRSNRVRPETAIKRLIDPLWKPVLQTPPFPEYTSGHSVISTSAAIILSNFFGDHFSFTDDTENEFGLPSRKFASFLQASDEAAVSRLYGGIHYRDAIENGMKEGRDIGNHILSRLPPGSIDFFEKRN